MKKLISVLLALLVCALCFVPAFAEDAEETECEHNWVWVTDQEPTCGAAGVKHEVCTLCGNTYGEGTPIPATNAHTWSAEPVETQAPTGCVDGYKRYVCEVCGQTKEETILSAGNHNWVWIVDEPAGALVAGRMHQVCTDCHAVQNMNTPIKPNYSNQSVDNLLLQAFDNIVNTLKGLVEQIRAFFASAM